MTLRLNGGNSQVNREARTYTFTAPIVTYPYAPLCDTNLQESSKKGYSRKIRDFLRFISVSLFDSLHKFERHV